MTLPKITELTYDIARNAHCPTCYDHLDWEVHDPGDFTQKWVAHCSCGGMWTMSIHTVEIKSI